MQRPNRDASSMGVLKDGDPVIYQLWDISLSRFSNGSNELY